MEHVLLGQLASSEASSSPQSLSPSQCHRLEMHFPEAHVNCSEVQVASEDGVREGRITIMHIQ